MVRNCFSSLSFSCAWQYKNALKEHFLFYRKCGGQTKQVSSTHNTISLINVMGWILKVVLSLWSYKTSPSCHLSWLSILVLHYYNHSKMNLIPIMPYIIILNILIILASGRYNQLCFLSEEVINRIIALTKEEGDAIDDKVGIYCCFE